MYLGFIDVDFQDQIELKVKKKKTEKNTPFSACPRDKSSPIEVRFSKFGPKMQRITVKIPINFGTLSCNFISFLILKPIFLINWDKILFELFCCAFDETIAVLKCFKSPDTLVLCGVK